MHLRPVASTADAAGAVAAVADVDAAAASVALVATDAVGTVAAAAAAATEVATDALSPAPGPDESGYPRGRRAGMQKLDISGTPEVTSRFRWQQYVAATLATLAALCGGSVLGWTAPVLPYLQHNALEPGSTNATTVQPLTIGEASWVGALASLGGLVGALPAGWAADKIGRRSLLLGLGALMCVAWIAVTFAMHSIWLLMGARLVLGAATGAVTVAVPLYCEEIAEPAVRGALGSYLDMMLALGIMWAYAAGALLPYQWLAAASATQPLVFCALFALMPESPVHLVAIGRWAAAERALAWLRGASPDSKWVLNGKYKINKCKIKYNIM